jgi:hypothetical protein
MDHHETVKVISHGSPPASPDLKFTRIAKKKWTKRVLQDNLSLSASTGNVLDDTDTNSTPPAATAVSLHSLQSNDSISLDRANFVLRNLKLPTESPLAAANQSTPSSSREIRTVSPAGGVASAAQGWPPLAVGKHKPSSSEGEGSSNDNLLLVSRGQQLRISGPLKRGQLDVIRRGSGADRRRNSPFSSFILDSNLLDVSAISRDYRGL